MSVNMKATQQHLTKSVCLLKRNLGSKSPYWPLEVFLTYKIYHLLWLVFSGALSINVRKVWVSASYQNEQ